MKFSTYLNWKIPQFLFFLLFLLFLSFVLFLSGTTFSFISLVFVSGLVFFVLYIYVSFSLYKKRIERIEGIISSLDEKYLVGEVLDPPQSGGEYEYYLLMKTISSASIEKIEKEIEEGKNYRDYLENWVHEIKTPLAAISLILDNGGGKQKIRRELKRAENITDTILSLSRLDNIEKDKNIRLYSIRQMVDEAVRDEMQLLIPQGIKIRIEGEGNAYTDHMLFSSILKQLLTNESKYAPLSTLVFSIEEGKLTMEDDGPGIPAHEIKRVVEKGYVGEQWRGSKGSGMGLYIVAEISKSLSIDFSIESKEGSFTRFVFRFPSILTKM